MYPATTREVQPSLTSKQVDAAFAIIAANNPELAGLTTAAIEAVAEHPAVTQQREASLDLGTETPLSGGWLDKLVATPVTVHEPSDAARQAGEHVRPMTDEERQIAAIEAMTDAAKTAAVAAITARMAELHRSDFALAA